VTLASQCYIIIAETVMTNLFLCPAGSDNLVGSNRNITEFHFAHRILTKFIKELQNK
jgi:hypothetical protein